jgi:hypothetical protein
MRTVRAHLLAWSIVALALMVSPAAARASCSAPTTEAGLESARVVFVGHVTALANRDRTATMEVDWVWKGVDQPEVVTVVGGSTEVAEVSEDDRTFQMGISYLVITPAGRQPFLANRCTATRPYQSVGSAIPLDYQTAVGSEKARLPVAPVAEAESGGVPIGPVLVIVGAAALVVVTFWGIIRLTNVGKAESSAATVAGRSAMGKRRSKTRLPKGDPSGGWFRPSGVSQASKLRGSHRSRRSG